MKIENAANSDVTQAMLEPDLWFLYQSIYNIVHISGRGKRYKKHILLLDFFLICGIQLYHFIYIFLFDHRHCCPSLNDQIRYF